MRRSWISSVVLGSVAAFVLWQPRAEANFHLWTIEEIYSNVDGSVQYIELITSANGQHVLAGHTITATSDGAVKTFTFAVDSPMGTTNKHLLIATPGFASLPGAVTPNYTLPCGPFFNPAATSITINFVGADSVTFTGASLPKDGINSLNDTGAVTLVSAANSPENFAGTDGALNLTACLIAGTCEPCDDGVFCNGAETCKVAACAPGPACADICDEDLDKCFECDDGGDCNDDNVCTSDACLNGFCENTNNAAACDDGLFCTATDVCSAGICTGSGDSCPGAENCSEGLDDCVDCLAPADCDDANPCTDELCTAGACSHVGNTASCDDGLFCTVVDTCAAGVCAGSGNACPGEICDEAGNVCLECDDAGDCDDGQECTTDACVSGACQSTNVTLGTACENDNVFCNGPEQCVSGECKSLGDPCGGMTTCEEASQSCSVDGAGGAGAGGNPGTGGEDSVAGASNPAAGGEDSAAGASSSGEGGGDSTAGGSAGRGGSSAASGSKATGGDNAAGTSNTADSSEDEGCGCRVAGDSGARGGWLAMLALCGLALRRSRRRA
jgi:MYXO-CTERM domain-containing protein